jgi:hypothetical protein
MSLPDICCQDSEKEHNLTWVYAFSGKLSFSLQNNISIFMLLY